MPIFHAEYAMGQPVAFRQEWAATWQDGWIWFIALGPGANTSYGCVPLLHPTLASRDQVVYAPLAEGNVRPREAAWLAEASR